MTAFGLTRRSLLAGTAAAVGAAATGVLRPALADENSRSA